MIMSKEPRYVEYTFTKGEDGKYSCEREGDLSRQDFDADLKTLGAKVSEVLSTYSPAQIKTRVLVTPTFKRD